jgi:hypothetical protein
LDEYESDGIDDDDDDDDDDEEEKEEEEEEGVKMMLGSALGMLYNRDPGAGE